MKKHSFYYLVGPKRLLSAEKRTERSSNCGLRDFSFIIGDGMGRNFLKFDFFSYTPSLFVRIFSRPPSNCQKIFIPPWGIYIVFYYSQTPSQVTKSPWSRKQRKVIQGAQSIGSDIKSCFLYIKISPLATLASLSPKQTNATLQD